MLRPNYRNVVWTTMKCRQRRHRGVLPSFDYVGGLDVAAERVYQQCMASPCETPEEFIDLAIACMKHEETHMIRINEEAEAWSLRDG